MAQLAPIAAVLTTGAALYDQSRQAAARKASSRQQAENLRAQQAAQAEQAATQQAAETRARDARLAGTIASARARLAAGGVAPDEGSAVALTAGLTRDAAAAQADSEALVTARLAAGRRSLLNPDGSLAPWLRLGSSFGNSLRNLLD